MRFNYGSPARLHLGLKGSSNPLASQTSGVCRRNHESEQERFPQVCIHELEKHSRGWVGWPWVRRGWDGVLRADLHDVVAKEHHLEEESDDYVEEEDWNDEYPAHA